MTKAVVRAVIVLLVGLPLGSGGAVGFAQSEDLVLNIDPLVQGEDRAVITRVLMELPPHVRQYVRQHVDRRYADLLYFDANGKIYSNRLRVKQDFRPVQIVGDGLYQDPYTGQVFAAPPRVPRPTSYRSQLLSLLPHASGLFAFAAVTVSCKDDGTGPYRAIFTKPDYGWVDAQIALPGNDTIRIPSPPNPTGDTGYVFEGGLTSGGDVDAGVFFNPALDSNNWALFYMRQGDPKPVIFPPGIPDPTSRFKANQTIGLVFSTLSVDMFQVIGFGLDTLGNFRTEWMIAPVPSTWGFSYTGIGMVVKRITSIAQTQKPPPSSFSTGSFFGHVLWQSAHLCCGPQPFIPPYFRTWADSDTQLSCWMPDTTHVRTVIQDAANESVDIDITPPPPPPPPGPGTAIKQNPPDRVDPSPASQEHL